MYFKPKETDEIDKENCSDCVPSTLTAAKDEVVEPKKQAMISKPSVRALDAEIRWALKIVMMHASYSSCLNLNELFMVMFPDSGKSFLRDSLWYSWVFPLQFVIPAEKISIFLHDYLAKVSMIF